MVELIKKFTKLTGEFFDFSKKQKAKKQVELQETVYKTRTQLIEEGKSAYLPKRYHHPVPKISSI